MSPQSSVLIPQSYTDVVTPLELLNLYYSDGQSKGNRENKLWRKMNSLLSWENMLERGYQADLCPLLFFIITKALPRQRNGLDQNCVSGEIVPDSILSHLKNHYLSSLRRNMILLEELKQVVEEFTYQGIKVVVLKGGYLAEHVYADIACRPMGDLDILIKDPDYETCRQILLGMDYLKLPENKRSELLHWSFHKDVLGEPVTIEVHHRLVKEVFMKKFNLEEIWVNKGMSLEFQIVYFSWHANRHGLTRILWLIDIVQMLKDNQNILDYARAVHSSKRFNVHNEFMLTMHLSNMLFVSSFNTTNLFVGFLMRYIGESFFLKIQKKLINREDEGNHRWLLTMLLMKNKDIIEFIPQYIKYRFI